MLLVGGAAGWFMRDDTDGSTSDGGSPVTVVGATVPGDLDQFAPSQRIATPPHPVVFDPANIIGLQPAGTIEVPASAALGLPLTAGGAAEVVDAITHEPVDAISPPERVATASTGLTALPPLATAENTIAPATNDAPTTTVEEPSFIDPCTVAATPCAGLPAVVTAGPAVASAELDPLQISLPVSGADGYAAQCDAIQGGEVPDTLLSPATRPTVVVLVNQPSTLALSGEWGDGATVEKTTMVTSPADDAEWKRSWDQDRVQRNIVACLTFALDEVRAHASAGVGQLRADIIAISATGRAEISGPVTLNIPTDGDDALFAERVVIADRGEQRRGDGVLYPTVHVHYAFVTEVVITGNPRLNPADTRVYAEHAFVEGADCAGWAVNQQGRDRTSSALFTVTSEERNVAGRSRNVTIVDAEVYLDPTMPSGWEGQFCMRLTATDQPPGAPGAASPKPVTLALRGTTLRSPRTPDYAISVLLDGPEEQYVATWTTPSGVTLCTEAVLTSGEPGATCAVPARVAGDGVWMVLRATDALLSVRVPINTAYCNPDDPFGALGDGCGVGFTQPLEIPNGNDEMVRLVLQVDRTAEAGLLWQDPSHAWMVGPVTSFAP